MALCQLNTPTPASSTIEPETCRKDPGLWMQSRKSGYFFQVIGKPFIIGVQKNDDCDPEARTPLFLVFASP